MCDIARIVAEWRKECNYTVKQLSELSGVKEIEILRIENGTRSNPSWKVVTDLSKAMCKDPFTVLNSLEGYAGVNDKTNLIEKNRGIIESDQFCTVLRVKQFFESACSESYQPLKVFRMGELFCGPGGIALGSKQVGIVCGSYSITHAWSNDFDENTCRTYRRNICPDNPESVICEDVHTLDIDCLGPIDAFAFGFPCNDFSNVGEKRGFEGTYGPLYTYGIKVLKKYQPFWFLAENVGGLSSANEGKAFEKIKHDMIEAGYRIYPNLYKFEEYGIPQARHRIIIVGIRSDLPFEFKVPKPSMVMKTCREAIENPPIPSDAPNNERTAMNKKVVERLKYIKPGQNAFTADLPDDLKLNIKGATISQIYKRLDPDKPAYTVTGSGGGGTHIYHWSEPRALTNRERARLQTFPDDFEFLGSKVEVARQIGNAVPPLLAEKVADEIKKCLDE